jgi:uncharacterized membrane protein
MHSFQDWLLRVFLSSRAVVPFMTSKWGWPACETMHFLGLSLLIGTIGMFDLRLLGIGRRIPIRALHKLVPWGISGFFVSLITGVMFLMTEPDQYIYNVAFHWKMLFMGLAGVNVTIFYLAVFRRVNEDAGLPAKLIAGASLFLWTGVIVFGRLLTFYRPNPCGIDPVGFLSTCLK